MIKISGRQVVAARGLLEMTREELAEACGLSVNTIWGLESSKRQAQQATVRTVVRELVARGIEFSNGTGLGVRLDFKRAQEYAASHPDQKAATHTPD